MKPWVTRTRRALRPSGGRSALTALDTASMPVSDEPPLANARSSVRMAAKVDQGTGAVADRRRSRVPGDVLPGTPPKTSRASPTRIIRPTEPENR